MKHNYRYIQKQMVKGGALIENLKIYQIEFGIEKISIFRFEISKKFLIPICQIPKIFYEKTKQNVFSNFVFFNYYYPKLFKKGVLHIIFFTIPFIQKQISTYSYNYQI